MEKVQINLAIVFLCTYTEGKTDGRTMVFVCMNHWNNKQGYWNTGTSIKITAAKFSASYSISLKVQF